METSLPIEYVIALTIVLTEMVKRVIKRRRGIDEIDPALPILTALVLGAGLNVLNTWLLAGLAGVDAIRLAVHEGLLAAGASMGVWSAGKSYIESRTDTLNPR